MCVLSAENVQMTIFSFTQKRRTTTGNGTQRVFQTLFERRRPNVLKMKADGTKKQTITIQHDVLLGLQKDFF